MEFFDKFINTLSETTATELMVIIPVTLVIYFVPTIIAIFRNRSQLKLVAIANIPAGLSWIAWVALIGWAVSGKALPKSKANKDAAAKVVADS